MDELARRLGANTRFFRDSLGISLAQLSARSGIAKSTLSQIEAGTTNPTLATLQCLAMALSVNVSDLVGTTTAESEIVLVRHGTGVDVSGESSIGRLMRTAMVGPSIVEFHAVELAGGAHETSPSHGAGSREHVLVVSGQLLLGPSDATATARGGDYVSYPGDRPHRFEAIGDQPAVYWIVATYPRRIGD